MSWEVSGCLKVGTGGKKSLSIFLAEKVQELHRVPHVTRVCAPLADESNHSAGGHRPPARDHQ